MARPKKIVIKKRGKTWYVHFQKDGERLRPSLQTEDEEIAKEIARDIQFLFNDPDRKVHPRAYEIFFGKRPTLKPETSKEKIIRQIRKFDDEDSEIFILGKLAERCDDLEQDNIKLTIENQKLKEELNSLKLDKEVKRIEKFRNLPTFKKVSEEYAKSVSHLDQGGALHTRLINKLISYNKCKDNKICDLDPSHIYDFLQKKYYKGSDPSETWNRQRRMLHRFWKWMSVQYGIDNIILNVETKKMKPRVLKNWHTVEEVEKELEAVAVLTEKEEETEEEKVIKTFPKDEYWKAIICIMAYAGLSAHEVRGLKKDDYDGEFITVQPYDERRTKSENRIRKIAVHKKYLRPRMDDYLKVKKKSQYLFPSKTFGSEQWTTHTFSRHLNRHIATEGMNALSLRRTFGSLLLRDGKTESEVAAAMGNTSTMVRKHYAKLLGGEVDIDF